MSEKPFFQQAARALLKSSKFEPCLSAGICPGNASRRFHANSRAHQLESKLHLLIDLQRSNGLNSNSAFGEVANNAAITLTDIDVRQAVDLMAMMLPFAAQRNCTAAAAEWEEAMRSGPYSMIKS